jgi:hypothetical protein
MQSLSLTLNVPEGAPQAVGVATAPGMEQVALVSLEFENLAQSAEVACEFALPLIPISTELSQAGQLDDPGPPEASRLPSALKTRVACCPDPGIGTVPPVVEASKLPDGAEFLKIIIAARAPPGTTAVVVGVDVAVTVTLLDVPTGGSKQPLKVKRSDASRTGIRKLGKQISILLRFGLISSERSRLTCRHFGPKS